MAAFSLVTFVPLALLTVVVVGESRDAISQQAHAAARDVAILQARVSDVRFALVTDLATSSAADTDVAAALARAKQGAAPADVQPVVDRLRRTISGVSHVALFTPDGRVVALSPAAPALLGQSFRHRDWYRGVTATGDTYVSEAFETVARPKSLVVGIAAPVTPDGTAAATDGYLLMTYRLDAIQQFTREFARDRGVSLTITDQRGVVLASPDQAPGLVSVANDARIRQALAGQSGSVETSESGRDVISGFAPVRSLGWAVHADIDRATALAAVERVRTSVLTVAGVLGMLFVLTLFGMSRVWRDRDRAEEALLLRESDLAEAQEIGQFGSWRYALGESTANWSANLLRMTGHGSQDGQVGPDSLRDLVAAEDRTRFTDAESAARRLGEPFALDHRVVTADGASRWFETRGEAIHGTDEHIIGLRGVCVDVTSRKEGEIALERTQEHLRELSQQLTRANADLRQSNEDLESFAYSASHDLAEPLRAVAGPVALLARRYQGALDADADTYISFAVDGCARMQAMIDAMLMYSRVGRADAGTIGAVDCSAVIAPVITNLRPRIDETGAHIDVGPLPVVRADPAQLAQLLQNLLTNAMKFVRPGVAPTISVQAERAGAFWELVVADNGIGIDPVYRNQVFDMFKRLHTRTEYAGTGIGLALCKRIVERFGGGIGVREGPDGIGSAFWFTLPAEEEKP